MEGSVRADKEAPPHERDTMKKKVHQGNVRIGRNGLLAAVNEALQLKSSLDQINCLDLRCWERTGAEKAATVMAVVGAWWTEYRCYRDEAFRCKGARCSLGRAVKIGRKVRERIGSEMKRRGKERLKKKEIRL